MADDILKKLLANQSVQDDEDVVEEAKSAPVRPEYSNFLAQAKKNAPVHSGIAPYNPEDIAANKLSSLDQLRAANPESLSQSELANLKSLVSAGSPVSTASQLLAQSPISPSGPAPANVLPSQPLPVKQEESEDEETPSSSSGPAATLAKFQALKASPTQNPPPVGDVLSKLLGQSQDQLQGAQQQRNQLQLLAQLGQAGSTLGQALTPLAPKQDYSSFWKTLEQQSQQPISDVANKQAMEKGVLQQQMLLGQAKTEMNQTDPNSAASRTLRDLIKKEVPSLQVDDSMSYNDLAKLEPSLARMASAKQALAMRMDALKTKGEEKQANALKDTQQMIETARGAKDIQNARETTRLIDNAKSLLAEYPDLNKMPAAQVSLFAQEMAKIAKGGVAGESEVRDIMPHSVASTVMKGLSQIENEPTGAQLSAFLKEYNPYLDTIKKNSQKLITDRTDRILKVQAPRLGTSNVQLMRDVYNPALSAPVESAKQSAVGPHGPSVTQGDHTYTWNPSTGKYE